MRASILFALATIAVGCIPVTDFDPVGTTASVSGSWHIDGAAPTEESCKDLVRPFTDSGGDPQVPRVRVTFLDDERSVPHSGLAFECTEGSFDTGENLVVATGEWTIRLEAIDGAGRVIAVGPSGSYSTADDAIALERATFWSGMVSAMVVIDAATPTAATCDALGVSSLQLSFETGGATATRAIERCAAGGVGTRVEPGVTYRVSLRALDAAGATIAETEIEEFVIGPGQHEPLNGGDPIELRSLVGG